MTTLEKIQAELRRQYDESRAHGIGWLNMDNPQEAFIDGHVDLVALAKAIDARPAEPSLPDDERGITMHGGFSFRRPAPTDG